MSSRGAGIGGIVFVGCMFLGGGIGSLLHEQHSGWLIGMGVGFIGLALTRVLIKK
ncbi:hypothetical protein [Gottfriedia acidiceleris]|uniref:hypothetical protein n=1 Tax=Gottfriedia acidiceleris TaxID=371036 RepID=UPI0014312C28|nr:hypothetical protein [Gottfriedia acidiceleris]